MFNENIIGNRYNDLYILLLKIVSTLNVNSYKLYKIIRYRPGIYSSILILFL